MSVQLVVVGGGGEVAGRSRQTLGAFQLPALLWSPQSGGAPPFTVKFKWCVCSAQIPWLVLR